MWFITVGQFGNMLVMLDGEDHKRYVRKFHHSTPCRVHIILRQRRALSLAFSNAAVRNLIPVFLDSASKVRKSTRRVIVVDH